MGLHDFHKIQPIAISSPYALLTIRNMKHVEVFTKHINETNPEI